jgi:hypothetical protein
MDGQPCVTHKLVQEWRGLSAQAGSTQCQISQTLQTQPKAVSTGLFTSLNVAGALVRQQKRVPAASGKLKFARQLGQRDATPGLCEKLQYQQSSLQCRNRLRFGASPRCHAKY